MKTEFDDIRSEPLISKKWHFKENKTVSTPKCILITGANSFIGVHIAYELANIFSGEIHLLVRAENNSEAVIKISNAFKKWELPVFDTKKYFIHVGNVCDKFFGLTDEEYKYLSENCDVVIHLAMNPVYHLPYRFFKETWLPEIEKMIEFCGNSIKTKSLHYASSFNANFFTDETDFFSLNSNAWQSGYAGFKWVVNKILENAFRQNLIGCIYDIPLVVGSKDKGICPENYSIWYILNIFLKSGLYFPFSFRIIPVDILATVIISNALAKSPQIYIRPVLKEAITEKHFKEHAQMIGLKESTLDKARKVYPGKIRFNFMIPENFYTLLKKIDKLEPVFPASYDWSKLPSTKDVFLPNLIRFMKNNVNLFEKEI